MNTGKTYIYIYIYIYIYTHTYIDIYTQSTHPRLTKRSIVYRQTLIVSRVCFQEKAYESYFNQMKSWFLKHSYLEHLIDTEYLIQEKELKKVNLKRYHFAVTYHLPLNF